MARVKGTAVSGRLEYARRRGGDEAVEQVVAAISDPGVRSELADGKALKSNWYPFTVLVDISLAIDRIYGQGDLGILEQVGGDVAEADLNSVYKFFMAMASPQYLMDKAASLWRNYYDSGEMVVIDRGENKAILELRKFESPHRAHCLAVKGWMLRTLTLCGCKNVRGAHDECRALGHARCVFEGRWD